MTQTLATYARSLGKLSQAAFSAQITCPVLVESAYSEPSGQGAKAFRTEFVDSAETMSSMLPADRREVLLVQKRAGSAFSGHIGVGRTPNLDICIPRTGISKFHAYFSKVGETWQLTDKESTNGTYVGGMRLVAGQAAVLLEGVEIQFANHPFQFVSPERLYSLLRSLAA